MEPLWRLLLGTVKSSGASSSSCGGSKVDITFGEIGEAGAGGAAGLIGAEDGVA